MRIRLRHEVLAEHLAQSNRSLNAWALRLELTSGHLSQLVNGKRKFPNAATRSKLLERLDLSFDELFEIVETTARAPRGAPSSFSNLGSPPSIQRALRRSSMHQFVDSLATEARRSLRALGRRPGFTLAALGNLTLGLGASLALFLFVYSLAFKPFPYYEPERLIDVDTRLLDTPESRGAFSWLDYRDLAASTSERFDLTAWDWEPVSLAGGSRPTRLGSGHVTANFSRVFGVPLLAGRWFTEEERRSGSPVTVLSEGVWRDLFGEDPAIVGRTVMLDGQSTTVVGVADAALDVPDGARLWLPLNSSEEPESRSSRWLGVYGRMLQDTSVEAAEAALDEAVIAIGATHPKHTGNRGALAASLREARVGPEMPLYLSMLGIVAVLLLIVTANLASLLMTRTVARHGELAVRNALGASRWRLTKTLLTENFMLAAIGLGLGTGLAWALQIGLLKLVPTERVPTWLHLGIDWRVALFSVVAAIAVILVASAVPTLLGSRSHSFTARGADTAGSASRLGRLITVAQVALCLGLLVCAGIFVSNLLRLQSVASGLRTEGGAVLGLDLLSIRSQPRTQRQVRFLEYRDRLLALPQVEAVGAIDRLPLGGGSNVGGVTVEAPENTDYNPFLQQSTVTRDYFRAAGLTLLEGSDFSDQDGRLEAAEDSKSVVISRSFADSVWPSGGALGKRLKFARPNDPAPWYTVRGVVSDVRYRGLDRARTPMLYRTENSLSMSRAGWLVRSDAPPAVLFEAIRSTVRAVDPNQPVHRLSTLDEYLGQALWRERLFAIIFWSFAILATLLSAFGLYGLLSFGVSLRRRELGVRMAVGASARGVAGLILGSALRMTALGMLFGAPIAWFGGRRIAGLLGAQSLETEAANLFSPMLLVGAAAVLLAAALSSAYLPSRRAARIAPTEVLNE